MRRSGRVPGQQARHGPCTVFPGGLGGTESASPGEGASGTNRSTIERDERLDPIAALGGDRHDCPATPAASPASQAGDRSDLLATTKRSRKCCDQLPVDRPQALRPIEDQQHQIGAAKLVLGPLDAEVLDRIVRRPQPGGIGELDGPASERGLEGDDVSRGARLHCRRSHAENRKVR